MQRHSNTARLMAFVKDQPNRWIPATSFEQFGRQAWRSRISDARKKFEAARDGTIENRQRWQYRHRLDCPKWQAADASSSICQWCKPVRFTISEYRYVPQADGELAHETHDANAWNLR